MNKTLSFALAAIFTSANAFADMQTINTKYERAWDGGAKLCLDRDYDSAPPPWATVYGEWGSPEATAAADAWAGAFALVKVWAKAEAEFKINRNTPRGLVKNVYFDAALSSGTLTVTLAEGTAEAVAGADSSSYAVAFAGKKDAQAKGVGSGWAAAEGVAGASAFAGSIAGTLSKSLSNVAVNTYGIKNFKAGLLMGNLSFADSAAGATAVADVEALSKAFAVAFAYVRQYGYGGKHIDVALDVDKDAAAAYAAASAFAKALAFGGAVVSVQASYNQAGHSWKKGWGSNTPEFDLTADAKVVLGCAAYADADAVADTAVSPTWGEEKDNHGNWHRRD
ncbi:hypothetical protein [Methylotetracoccus oryzae]|uniref:hypothetical protein n=1 Tax=Methylotetracoccus oryzae TaxID=1919059 RepID=UPI001118163E|nr:hypothetical protein [Methylotetracoccus oryzae]